MFESLRRLLGGTSEGAGEARTPGQDRIRVATAVLLLEMAHADERMHDIELALVQKILQERFTLSEETLGELMALAEDRRRESLDLYQFSREINEHFSKEEKLEVMEHLWRVVFADGEMDPFEEALARQLATLLRLSHREMIDAKLQVQKELGQGGGSGEQE